MTVSPKRKRGPSDPAVPTPFAPRINTSAFPGPGPITCNGDPHTATPLAPLQYSTVGSESPRTRVARQFGNLQLDAGAALPKIDFGNSAAADSTSMSSKKAKHVYERTDTIGRDSASGNDGFGHDQNLDSYSSPPHPVLEIAETPQSAFGGRVSQSALSQQPPSPPTPSSSPSVKFFLSTTGRRPNTSQLRARSPPSDLASSANSPNPNAEPLDPTALTWQDSEITGHEIDQEREDDGYGINGIGFRPTHAVAQHRALKRRQQILEWRAREAREARQKRSERRRLGASSSISERKIGEFPKRAVRFAS